VSNITSRKALTGLIAAPFTALHSDRRLNLPMIKRQAQALVDNGVTGAFICGTTGEGLSLTTQERKQIAEAWIAAAPASLKIIVHVGHASLSETNALAVHAQKIGAAAFASIGPTFFRVSSVEQLVEYNVHVAAAAPRLPYYYYHIPAMAGADVPMFDFLNLAGERIPNLAGIKFTHENLMDYSRCVNFKNGQYNILIGRDEILLAALALGATGAVGSTYNYMAGFYHRVIEAFKAGNLESARSFQAKAVEVIAIMSRRGGLPAGKAIMKMIGLDCGPVRPPLQSLSSAAFETLRQELKAIGFPAATKHAHK
jgi:N-acetylneuraminate lyase